jgi:G protein-coupled receptor 107
VSYIYFTRIVVFLITTTLPYSYAYWSDLMSEGATLAFYVVVGWKFRPKER